MKMALGALAIFALFTSYAFPTQTSGSIIAGILGNGINLGVDIGGGVHAHVGSPQQPPNGSNPNHTDTPPVNDPGADLLRLGIPTIRLAIGGLNDRDLNTLKFRCRDVLDNAERFGPSIIAICHIVEDKLGGLD